MIEIRGLTFTYSEADSAVLRRVNLDFAAGEFSLVTGPTGSGKTTFLKAINRLVPNFTPGSFTGQVLIDSHDVTHQKPHQIAELVGYVSQHPEDSFVALTVIEELAFAMEQLGFGKSQMQTRIGQVASLVGITHLLHKKVNILSGGEQQRVAIGAALTAGQKVLLLDEPTSSLDLKSAHELVKLLRDLAANLGITVIVAEHRLERLLGRVDSIVTINTDGSVIKADAAAPILDYRIEPPLYSLSKKLGWYPLENDLAGARAKWAETKAKYEVSPRSVRINSSAATVAQVSDLAISYDSTPVVAGVSLTIKPGGITALMGANGSGKTSCLWAIQGSGQKSAGSVCIKGVDPSSLSALDRLSLVAMVPQQASDLLFLETLAEELHESDDSAGAEAGATARIFEQLAGRLDTKTHPRDLSSGQQLALVLASQLVKDAALLLLDEPTRGFDYSAKRHLAKQLLELSQAGKAIILASHDVEFIAQICDSVVVLADGAVAIQGTPEQVFTAGSIYETQIGLVTQTPGLLIADQIQVTHET